MNQIQSIEEWKKVEQQKDLDAYINTIHQQLQKAREDAYQAGRAYEAQQCRGSAADNHPNAPYELPELYPWKDAFNRLTTENDHSEPDQRAVYSR